MPALGSLVGAGFYPATAQLDDLVYGAADPALRPQPTDKYSAPGYMPEGDYGGYTSQGYEQPPPSPDAISGDQTGTLGPPPEYYAEPAPTSIADNPDYQQALVDTQGYYNRFGNADYSQYTAPAPAPTLPPTPAPTMQGAASSSRAPYHSDIMTLPPQSRPFGWDLVGQKLGQAWDFLTYNPGVTKAQDLQGEQNRVSSGGLTQSDYGALGVGGPRTSATQIQPGRGGYVDPYVAGRASGNPATQSNGPYGTAPETVPVRNSLGEEVRPFSRPLTAAERAAAQPTAPTAVPPSEPPPPFAGRGGSTASIGEVSTTADPRAFRPLTAERIDYYKAIEDARAQELAAQSLRARRGAASQEPLPAPPTTAPAGFSTDAVAAASERALAAAARTGPRTPAEIAAEANALASEEAGAALRARTAAGRQGTTAPPPTAPGASAAGGRVPATRGLKTALAVGGISLAASVPVLGMAEQWYRQHLGLTFHP
jgi:hypothetical protein